MIEENINKWDSDSTCLTFCSGHVSGPWLGHKFMICIVRCMNSEQNSQFSVMCNRLEEQLKKIHKQIFIMQGFPIKKETKCYCQQNLYLRIILI